MVRAEYIIAVDQGTTGTTGILLNASGKVVRQTYREIPQVYPRPGWVEQVPTQLFDSCIAVMHELLEEAGTSPHRIMAMGVANQRETTIVWDRGTGVPVANAVVWQCRRSAPLCEALKNQGLEAMVRSRTGLPIDAYSSATKLRWLLDSIPSGQRRAEAGELLFGTVDTWLLWNLTGGAVHATDVTNASRTMLYNIDTLSWDPDLLRALDIPGSMLPEVRSSSETYGHTSGELFGGQGIPICGVAGDQQAALFGQACFKVGMAKNTYGTGSFVLMNAGPDRVSSGAGLITTVAWAIGDETTYALEGSIFSAGATVQWLRDDLQIIDASPDVDALAATVPDNGGVYLVPAFAGLGAPYWDMYARGTMVGLTRGATRAHIARAALEATAYQTRDVIDAMTRDAGAAMPLMRVDGGSTASTVLMQFQADILGLPIERCAVPETTALGAAYLAGLAAGLWSGQDELEAMWESDRRFEPRMGDQEREALYRQWRRAVARSRNWAEGGEQ